MRYDIPAILFAGGKSSRMGEDKALLPFNTHTSLSAYQYDKLTTLFERVYLSTKEEKFDFDAPLILDRFAVHSPLAALVSIFETLDAETVFVLSVDMPFIEKEQIEKLMQASGGPEDAVIAQSPDGKEPLFGLYRRTIFPTAREQLEKNRHRLTTLLDSANTRYLLFDDAEPFMNLNRPEDYEKAKKRIDS